ncbi:hypothetical protein QJS10_CPA03g00993 [Acorus calamus]|uniref:Sororin C-terminal region domain-containing protein n=1 Tax=Acorus calamus TaxID=4465 RepID=A0AAV9F3L1_ACOCL|nr:hypothetical protein QJS10_CPA03g00993 [Acorus calamus]
MGKIIIVPLSCPPVARARIFEDKLKRKHKDAGNLKIFPVPDTKSKKKRRYKVPGGVEKHKLSQDFIDKQRAYFKEIDDFELQVEAVSEGEME